jgi:hypothetical protein
VDSVEDRRRRRGEQSDETLPVGLKQGGLHEAPFMHWHQDKPGCCVKANVFEIDQRRN